MKKYIPLDALVAEINRLMKWQEPIMSDSISFNAGHKAALNKLLVYFDTLEVKEVDLELITGWFDHIAQIANDRKTLNGVIMEDWAALDEIKCLARNSSEFITMHYKTQKGE